jgi:hypothetical protein
MLKTIRASSPAAADPYDFDELVQQDRVRCARCHGRMATPATQGREVQPRAGAARRKLSRLLFGTLNPDVPPLIDYLGGITGPIDEWLDRNPVGLFIDMDAIASLV